MMKEEYASQFCAVCSAPADGLHYGAISCRSCNAFFRRTVVEKAQYRCKYNNSCLIDPDGRCACRSCRFSKCIEAGMKVSAVQPKRDPTGSQKDRRKRTANNRSMSPMNGDSANSSFSSAEQSVGSSSMSNSFLVNAIKSEYDFVKPPQKDVSECFQSPEKLIRQVKIELDDGLQPSTSSSYKQLSRMNTPLDDEQNEFRQLVYAFGEHQRMMQLSFSTFEQFLDELDKGKSLRLMEPNDVNKLSAVELTGLLYWIEKLRPYSELPREDKSILLQRYSVRKLSLDHFYSASKHPQNVERGEFVMNNYTFVPAHRTGFELPDDDEKQIEAKRQTFAPTFARFWNNVIRPFVKLKVTDAEIVYLQIMLLWSTTNNEYVTPQTRSIMKERRDWAMNRLFEWYFDHSFEDVGVRFGTITLLLGEIELICDMHCQDFQVAKLFEFCDMSKFWYESLCYAPCNTKNVKFDPHLFESLKEFTALGVIEKHGGGPMSEHQAELAWQRLNNFTVPPMAAAAAVAAAAATTDPHRGAQEAGAPQLENTRMSSNQSEPYIEHCNTQKELQSHRDTHQMLQEDMNMENMNYNECELKQSEAMIGANYTNNNMNINENLVASHNEPFGMHNSNGYMYHDELMFPENIS